MKVSPRVLAVGVIIGLGLCGTGWRFFTDRSRERPVTVNLPSELANLENERNEWGSIFQINPFQTFQNPKESKNKKLDTMRIGDPVVKFYHKIFDHQVELLKSLATTRRKEMETELLQFQNLKLAKMNSDIRNKASELDTRYKKVLTDQRIQNQKTLRNYQLELEESQKSVLANLQLKIAVSEISHLKDSTDAEQDLESQIERIHREKNSLLQRREVELQIEEEKFQNYCQEKKKTELLSFENDARDRINREMEMRRQQFQRECDLWYQEHFGEMLQKEDLWKSKGVYQ